MHSIFFRLKLFSVYFKKSLDLSQYVLNRSLSSVQIGSSAQLCRTFTAEDVKQFTELTGDSNPIHSDPKFCSETKFSKPIVHGMLTNGLVSAVFGTVLPGPGAVVVKQTINYTKPLYVGEEVCAQITVTNVKMNSIECKYICSTISGKQVLDGTAKLVMISNTL